MKQGTVALVVCFENREPVLVQALSDDHEIALLEQAMKNRVEDPLSVVIGKREHQAKEDEDFGDYVEGLLTSSYVKPEIQRHGVQWLKSKIRIEQFQRNEADATQIIAQYAMKVFAEDPRQVDFILSGYIAKVRIRVFVLDAQVHSSQQKAA